MKTSITTKLPFVLHLSQHLLSPGRSLMPYEAVQIGKDFGLSVASRSQRWELRPANINGVPHASLCKMSKAGGTLHPSATWIFPVAEDVGVLFLDGPLGSGRAPTAMEQVQLRSIEDAFRQVRDTWALKPAGGGVLQHIEVIRRATSKPEIAGRVFCTELPLVSSPSPSRSSWTLAKLSVKDRQRLQVLF